MKKFFKGFKEGQKGFSEKISIIINSILLSFVYFIGIGITSLTAKILNKNFLDEKFNNKKESYWKDIGSDIQKKEDYYRQF